MTLPAPRPAGSRDLPDDSFVAAVEAASLPNERFRHWDHLRFAFLLVRAAGPAPAADRVCAAIRRYAARHGAPHKYHDTLTRAWVHFVAVHEAEAAPDAPFDDFAAANPALFDPALPRHFWSADLLDGAAARAAWVAPDLRPLPVIRAPLTRP